MRAIEELEVRARQKLVAPGNRHANQSGFFYMPTQLVQEWYSRSDVPSSFRGLYLNPTALLGVTVSDRERYKAIEIRLAAGMGKYEWAHWLQWQTLIPRLESVVKRGRIFPRVETLRPPSDNDLEALTSFIDNADSRNLLLPFSYAPGTDHNRLVLTPH